MSTYDTINYTEIAPATKTMTGVTADSVPTLTKITDAVLTATEAGKNVDDYNISAAGMWDYHLGGSDLVKPWNLIGNKWSANWAVHSNPSG